MGDAERLRRLSEWDEFDIDGPLINQWYYVEEKPDEEDDEVEDDDD